MRNIRNIQMIDANFYIQRGINDKMLIDLSNALKNLQSAVIGAFLINYNPKLMELVIEKSDHHVRCITIGTIFGVSDSTYDISVGKFIPLPKGYENLAQLVNKPFEFNAWMVHDVQKM